jgi:hypothetical protein
MPVVPITLVAGVLMVVVSRLTAKPSAQTIGRYFQAL